MSKKNKKVEVKDLWVDGDHLLYAVGMSNRYKDGFDTQTGEYLEGDDWGKSVKLDISAPIKHMEEIIEDYQMIAEVESICYGEWTLGKTYVVFGGKKNFRYDILPTYKGNRSSKGKGDIFYALQKYARKKYICTKGYEADDIVAYHVRNGAIGVSTDKDILKSEGIWFDAYHSRRYWVENSKEEAYKFLLMQCLAGDGIDNIDGIDGVGLLTAKNLLDEEGYTWESVVKIYKEKGLTKKDAILTRNLVDMTLWSPKKGIVLFKG